MHATYWTLNTAQYMLHTGKSGSQIACLVKWEKIRYLQKLGKYYFHNIEWAFEEVKLDGVGPVDNRPSTN